MGEKNYLFSEGNWARPAGRSFWRANGAVKEKGKQAGNLLCQGGWDTAPRSKRFPAAASQPWERAECEGAWINWKIRWKQEGCGRLCFQQVSIRRWEAAVEWHMVELQVRFSVMEQFWSFWSLLVRFGLLSVKLSQVLPFPGYGQLKTPLQNAKEFFIPRQRCLDRTCDKVV